MNAPLIPLERQIACVERELAQRRRVYARRVAEQKMTREFAADEIAAMSAVLETLQSIDAKTRLL